MDDLPLQKIAISGPTLASLIQRFSSAAGDINGLLFGRVAHVLHSSLSDDGDLPSATPTDETLTLVATVTGFLCSTSSSSFYTPDGRLRSPLLGRIIADRDPRASLLGWFSGRRRTPLRPSMRECSVSSSLSTFSQSSFSLEDSTASFDFRPCVFLLLATPLSDQIVHTQEYRAYQYRPLSDSFDPKSVSIVNLGPAFRGHYGAFTASSPFPALSCDFRSSSSAMAEDRKEDNLNEVKRMQRDQQDMDKCAEGFDVRDLGRLMGPEAANYRSGLEEMYEKMLEKLEGLTHLVEYSSAKVLEQENHNLKLRNKVAALD